ncbi:Phage-related baseplate assembly protein [Enhygromyxa salina]|uniref:Phage-related baseplate assembly protein n=1 Tax=Enhygromyxa salina TaxID=215803 RepID=A0A2S9XRZ9_9BACT|nr:type VI secretion system tip protein TssI/VgrG [Enhygromyxa salina]PRP95520.1 Phage-related baseplate assembly protein [Enhygromyxa salina]
MSETDDQPVRLRFFCDSDSETQWEVSGLQLSERFNEPYQLRVELRTQDSLAEPIAMLGASVTVTVERGSLTRDLCGIVERVEDGINQRDHVVSTLTVVPAMIALAHRKTSRIFQDMTIPDILAEVFNEALGPYERSVNTDFLTGDYSPQEYTVQYRESDLDFVDRLMEEYGIVYCFKHADDVETLTLIDDPAAYEDLISYGNDDGTLPVVLRGDGSGTEENIHAFHRESKLRPSVARTAVFDWLSPGPAQLAEDDTVSDLGFANGAELGPEREDYEHEEPSTLYGYRSEGLDFAAVEDQVRLRRVVHQRDATRCVGMSTATGLSPGMKFELVDHPHTYLEGQYLVVAVEHSAGNYAAAAGGEAESQDSYNNRFECVPIDLEWRPARKTPRPRIPAMQTATVVGPSGEEIHTDEHGRIKVQFHWDRDGASDEASSCFIRVVQPWAGNGWGFVFLPRIGMEVAVTFVDGDPDRPVVTGCLYNGANTPPYPLPDDKTKSTIKSESSPGGGGFNELRLEDAAGSEEIYIHAQKDLNEVVLNDHNTTVGNNQTNNVDVDQTQTVHGNQSETVDGDQEMTVGGKRTVHVKGDFEETVDGTETRTVTGAVTETFGASETRDIGADITETVGGGVTRTITGDVADTVSGSLTETITGGITTTTPGNLAITATGGINMTTTGSMLVTATGGFTVLAPGGTKTVDVDFWKFGGGQGDAFSWQLALVGAKTDIVGLAVATTGTKVEACNIAISACMAEMSNDAMAIESKGQAVALGAIGIWSFGLSSLL